MNPARYAKAIVSALVAGLGTLATALADDGIEAQEWVWIAIAFLTALGAVFVIPNQAGDPVDALADRDRRVQRADLDERLHEPGQHRRGRLEDPEETRKWEQDKHRDPGLPPR